MMLHKLLTGLALFVLLLSAVTIVGAAMPLPEAVDETLPLSHDIAAIAPASPRVSPRPSAQSLDAWKQAPGTAAPGETISYTITIQPYVVAGMAMTDTLPVGAEFAGNLSASAGSAWYDDTANTVFWEYVPPPPGAAASAQPYAWAVLATPLTATTRTAGAVDAAGNFYIIGGDSAAAGGQQQYGQVQRYDPAAGTWDNSLATMPVPLGGVCAAVIGDDIYVPGGLVGTQAHTELQVYHIATDTWDIVESDPLPEPRGAIACAAYAGQVYVIGGNGGTGYVSSTWAYDPLAAPGLRWTTLADVPQVGANGAALAVGDLIFYAGMRDSDSPDLPDVYAYDPSADTWIAYPDLSTPRGGAGIWAIGDLLLVGGGGWESYLTSIEQYDTTQGAGGTWVPFNADLSQGRRTFAFASDPVHGRLFAGNGFADVILKQAEQLDFEGLPPPVHVSFDVVVAGDCGDVIVNQGVAQLGGATRVFSATTTVGNGPSIVVSPPSLAATVCTGATGTQTLSICNEGDCPLEWVAGEQAAVALPEADDVPWLGTSPISGTVAGGACQDVDVIMSAGGLAPGDYNADLVILSNDLAMPVASVPVTLTAQTCQRFVYLPAVMKGGP